MRDGDGDGDGDQGRQEHRGLDSQPFPDFSSAARSVLDQLQRQVGMRLWMVTRAAGEHQVVLQAQNAPEGYDVSAGTVLSWSGSLCAAMVAGDGPHIAPRVADVPAFASAPNRRRASIEAYVGVPLLHPDGQLFGTLCGFDPEPQDDHLADAEDLVLLQARLLSTLLHLELSNDQLLRRAERAETAASTDVLTGAGNRRGWLAVMAAEESRCRRYGHPACVLALDLDALKLLNDTEGHAAGDQLLRRAAEVLRSALRSSDYVARVGGDEFAVLAVETDGQGGHREADRLRAELDLAGVGAAVGVAARAPDGSLEAAWHAADADMYRHKASRRS